MVGETYFYLWAAIRFDFYAKIRNWYFMVFSFILRAGILLQMNTITAIGSVCARVYGLVENEVVVGMPHTNKR